MSRTTISCGVCGAPTLVYPCDIGRKKYCSKACLGVANGRRFHLYDVRKLVAQIDTDECVEWPGSRTKRGYGKATLDGKFKHAHAAALIVAKGPLKKGQMACHDCDNPPCFNPRHIYAGTSQTNSDDKVRRGRVLRGSAVGTSVLTEAQAKAIRADGRTQLAIAAEYGISPTTVARIQHGRGWKHV